MAEPEDTKFPELMEEVKDLIIERIANG